MKPDELANEIERLDREATAAPWYPKTFGYESRDEQIGRVRERLEKSERLALTFVRHDGPDVEIGTTGNGPIAEENAALFCALRNAAPLIVAALRLAECAMRPADICTEEVAAYRAARAASESR